MEISLLLWFFQGIPESLALGSLAVVLAGQALKARPVLLVGLPQAVTAYLVRHLSLTFGMHTIALLVMLAIWLNIFLKVRISRSLPAALAAIIILAAAEVGMISLIMPLSGIPFEEIIQNDYLLIAFGWPHIILLFALALGIDRWKKKRRMPLYNL